MNDKKIEPTDNRQLCVALSKAQADIRSAALTKENTFLGSKYADLEAVWDAIREPLTSNGLSVTQTFEPDGDNILLFTILWHSSGQSITSVLPLLGVTDWHSLGSAITYARRYALAALVGCAPQGWDDDGNHAQQQTRKTPAPRNASKGKSSPREYPSNLTAKALAIIDEVPEADEWLRNKQVDPGNPPDPVCERIVTLGSGGLRKTIEKDRKAQAKADKEEEAAKVVAEADAVEPIDEGGNADKDEVAA